MSWSRSTTWPAPRVRPPCRAELRRHQVALHRTTAHFDTDRCGLKAAAPAQDQSSPVIDRFDRLIGIVTKASIFCARLTTVPHPHLATLVQALLRRTPGHYADKPEVVGQIMSSEVFTATPQTPLSELIRQDISARFAACAGG